MHPKRRVPQDKRTLILILSFLLTGIHIRQLVRIRFGHNSVELLNTHILSVQAIYRSYNTAQAGKIGRLSLVYLYKDLSAVPADVIYHLNLKVMLLGCLGSDSNCLYYIIRYQQVTEHSRPVPTGQGGVQR